MATLGSKLIKKRLGDTKEPNKRSSGLKSDALPAAPCEDPDPTVHQPREFANDSLRTVPDTLSKRQAPVGCWGRDLGSGSLA